MSNCTRFDCIETAVGAVILASGVVCPPFNDTECIQVCGNAGSIRSHSESGRFYESMFIIFSERRCGADLR